ncbi:MAG: peptidase [Sphingobium sp.]|nr:peptidase [Sphingobium sp.]
MVGMLLGLSLAAASLSAHPGSDPCAHASAAASASERGRHATIADLMCLRDIGGQGDDEPPFSLSPDGTKLAVALRQADPDRNDYRQSVLVIDIKSGKVGNSIVVRGGVALCRFDLPTIPDFGGGVIATNLPRWSPDGLWLAYLERRDGIMQVVRAKASGGESVAVTQSKVDVRSFSWSADGSEILFSSRPDNIAAARVLVEEGARGFRFDERWIPEWRPMPFPAPSPDRHFAIAIGSGAIRDDRPATVEAVGDVPVDEATSPAGNVARIAFLEAGVINGPKSITVSTRSGVKWECRDASCALATRLWWRDERHLIFARRAGWGNNLTELVSWDILTDRKRLLMRTSDLLAGCRPAPVGLVCVIEGSRAPRRLFVIDYATGARRLLFDPNPQWADLDLGRVRRLFWQNDRGLKTFGDLVLPPGRARAAGLPLVVVGYRSRGFLRGGSGDLFPIFPLAAKGFAVLVYERPEQVGNLAPVASQAESDRLDLEGWADKKSGASSIMTAVSMLVRDGIIDRKRIGLTGFSDGVDKGTYTLIHNDIFRAVALAGCCSDPVMVNASIGPYLARQMIVAGYPAYRDRGSERVSDYSLAANADRIYVPILMQVGDREYLRSLEVEAAFRQAGRPLSLYVFPDEYHNLWQPAHRQAAYSRNLAWFDYHLLHDGKGPMPEWIRPMAGAD